MPDKSADLYNPTALQAAAMAQRALDKIDAHEKYCEERGRRAEIFEAEMRHALPNIAESINKGLSRVHNRLDSLIRGALVGVIGITISLISYIWLVGERL